MHRCTLLSAAADTAADAASTPAAAAMAAVLWERSFEFFMY